MIAELYFHYIIIIIKKGDDAVIYCTYSDERFYIVHGYISQPKFKPILIGSNEKIGLTDISFSFSNSILTCSFRRTKSIPNQINYFDLNDDYYLLFAKGVSLGILLEHVCLIRSNNNFNYI